MKVLLVDQQVLFREGVAGLIRLQPGLSVVGEAASGNRTLELTCTVNPDLILMDFHLSDGDGLEVARRIRADYPQVAIVFLTNCDDDEHLFGAIRLGAKGYLSKNVSFADLMGYLRGLQRGEPAITPAVASRIMERLSQPETALKAARSHAGLPGQGNGSLDHLTPRERDVLDELARGASNREIALKLVISENTVKHHVGSILDKLHLRSRRQIRKPV